MPPLLFRAALLIQQSNVMSEIISLKKKTKFAKPRPALSFEHAYVEFLVQGMRAKVQSGGLQAGEKAFTI